MKFDKILYLFCTLFIVSCVSKKDLILMNENIHEIADFQSALDSLSNDSSQLFYNTYKVRPFDNLHIKVTDFQDNTSNYFNSENRQGILTSWNAQLYFTGYMVNDSGFINLPIIGYQKVAGLTLEEIKDKLDKMLEPHIKFASSTVKLSNFRVSVLGEVVNPGVQFIYDERVSLLQVLSNAGGLTPFANIRKVKLVRERDGYKTIDHFDLSKTGFLSTRSYNLQPNDVIYVEPLSSRTFNINTQTLSILLSAISVTALVANVIIQNSQNN